MEQVKFETEQLPGELLGIKTIDTPDLQEYCVLAVAAIIARKLKIVKIEVDTYIWKRNPNNNLMEFDLGLLKMEISEKILIPVFSKETGLPVMKTETVKVWQRNEQSNEEELVITTVQVQETIPEWVLWRYVIWKNNREMLQSIMPLNHTLTWQEALAVFDQIVQTLETAFSNAIKRQRGLPGIEPLRWYV